MHIWIAQYIVEPDGGQEARVQESNIPDKPKVPSNGPIVHEDDKYAELYRKLKSLDVKVAVARQARREERNSDGKPKVRSGKAIIGVDVGEPSAVESESMNAQQKMMKDVMTLMAWKSQIDNYKL